MTAIDLDALEALAKAATPGPWQMDSSSRFTSLTAAAGDVIYYTSDDDGLHGNCPGDLPYMEAVDPTTVLALLSRLRAAEAVVTAARRSNNGEHFCEDVAETLAAYDDARKGEG